MHSAESARSRLAGPAGPAPLTPAASLPTLPPMLRTGLHASFSSSFSSVGMDRALGCLLGVAVGDAAGATLEGRAAQLTPPAAAQAAMRMPGSAMPYLGKGQVTDDTELTICLARGEMGGCYFCGRGSWVHESCSAVEGPSAERPGYLLHSVLGLCVSCCRPVQAWRATSRLPASRWNPWQSSTATGMMLVPLAAGRCGDCDAVNAGQCVQQAETACEMLYMPVTRVTRSLTVPWPRSPANCPSRLPYRPARSRFQHLLRRWVLHVRRTAVASLQAGCCQPGLVLQTDASPGWACRLVPDWACPWAATCAGPGQVAAAGRTRQRGRPLAGSEDAGAGRWPPLTTVGNPLKCRVAMRAHDSHPGWELPRYCTQPARRALLRPLLPPCRHPRHAHCGGAARARPTGR